MKISNLILFPLFLVFSTFLIGPSPSFRMSASNRTVPDSIKTVQFGIDSTMVDSLLIHRLESKRFVFRYSSHFLHADQLRANAPLYDAFCDTVTRLLHLPDSSFKTIVYLYADTKEWSSCVRGWPPPDRENRAVTFLFEICSYGLLPIEHETVHVLSNRFVAYSKSAFFAEGIEQYVEQVRSDDTFRYAVRTAKKFLREPFEQWANDSIGIWATPVEDSDVVAYPVSGLFVKHLIQRSGLDTFKQFYRRIRTEVSTEVAFSVTYGYSLSNAISQFKTTIAN